TFVSANRTVTVYLDGSQVAQGVLAARPNVGNSIPVGIGHNGTTGSFWNGKLDDVRIWNIARSAPEIAGAFSAQLIGSPTGMVSNWYFDDGSGTNAIDNVGTS